MKKLITLSLLAFTTLLLSAQGVEPSMRALKTDGSQAAGYVLDSLRYWLFDSASQMATISRRQINSIDVNQNNPRSFSQTWTGSSWVNKSNYLQTYDARNNLTSQIWQRWNGTAWANYVLTSYTYDTRNNTIIRLTSNWDGTNWINSQKDSSVYDVNNNQTSTLNQVWSGSTWTNSGLNLYTYNANNKQTSNLSLAWTANAWAPAFRDTLLYNTNGKVRLDSTQTWASGAWHNAGNYISNYDAQGRLIEYAIQGFLLSGQPAPIEEKYVYTYYPFDYTASDVRKFWNGSKWLNIDSTRYYWSQATLSIDQPELGLQKLVIYPNPVSAIFNISSTSLPDRSRLEIFDKTGTMVHSEILTRHSIIDISTLSAGVYFARLLNGSETIGIQKIVKE